MNKAILVPVHLFQHQLPSAPLSEYFGPPLSHADYLARLTATPPSATLSHPPPAPGPAPQTYGEHKRQHSARNYEREKTAAERASASWDQRARDQQFRGNRTRLNWTTQAENNVSSHPPVPANRSQNKPSATVSKPPGN